MVCSLTLCLVQVAYSIPPGTPNFFYNTITQHPYCAGYTPEDDHDPLECDGVIAGGQQAVGQGPLYLWVANREEGKCGGCVEYLADSTPTFWFNVADEDGEGEEVWFELEIDTNQQFTSPLIRYLSKKLLIKAEGSVDWEFTVGQEPQCEDTNCGYYDSGDASTALHSYGDTADYYWRIRACDAIDAQTERCDPLNGSLWLCSGGGDCGTDGDDTDTNPWNNAKAFSYAPYFINADDTEDSYETVGAVTSSSARVVVVTPHELDSFSIEYGVSTSYGSQTTPHTNVTGAINTEMSGLSPDTLYHYRITWTESGETLMGKDRTFRTAGTAGSPFTFLITADIHWMSRSDYYYKMVGTLKPLIEQIDADFWVDLGDFVTADAGIYWTQDHADALYIKALRGINPIAHSLPFIPVVGNHEAINQYYGLDSCPPDSTRCQDITGVRYGEPLVEYQGNARTSFFPLYDHGIEAGLTPDYKTFFSWEWGDALCIALDPYLYTTEYPTYCDGTKPVFTLGEAQKNWLNDLLAQNTRNWVFIFIHQHGGQSPNTQIEECYGRGGASTLPYAAQLDEWIGDLTGANNIIIFLGHDHIFSTGLYEGLRFVTCPMPESWQHWPFDELGYRNEDWIYDEGEETFSATIESIDIETGRIAVGDYSPPPPASEIYQAFTLLSLRNYGQEGNQKRFQRYLRKVDPGNPSIGFDNGFVSTGTSGYLYVSTDDENDKIDHPLAEWAAGDRIYVHRAEGGVVTVDVASNEVVVRMLNTEGDQVVYPGLYNYAGKDVALRMCLAPPDSDSDGVGDACDNCPDDSNPEQDDGDYDEKGTVCDNCPGTFNPDQEDAYPPQGNGIGNACDCEGDFNCDQDVDGTDASLLKADFGRSQFNTPCEGSNPCHGDFDCDSDVDGTDTSKFKEDFGRSPFKNPCPSCVVQEWCMYP